MNARERAAYYLNIKPRTKYQVEQYLKQKGHDPEEIRDAVKELEEYNYINDKNFCMMYFEAGFEKGHGVARIKRELVSKGVESNVVEDVYYELEDIPCELDAALEIGNKVIGNIEVEALDYNEKRKLQAKIGRRIVSRGFSSDTAYKVMSMLVK